MNPNSTLAALLVMTFLTFVPARSAHAHCQVPCGIYDDHARVEALIEDAATIEKAAKLINELASKRDAQSQNQLVRWVNTKELHAEKVIATISNYFLTQRVKSSQKDYVERLKRHHAVIVAAMEAKQNADTKFAAELRERVAALKVYYPAE